MNKIYLLMVTSLLSLSVNSQTVVETVSSGTSGDATLIVEADTDNNNEDDNPKIMLKQDGSLVIGEVGINGSAAQYTDALVNSMFIGTTTTSDASLQLITKDIARLTLHSGGNVGIGTTAPGQKLDVNGNINANGSYYYGDIKEIIDYSDNYLRLNQNGDFTSGTYTPNRLRVDDIIQVGSGSQVLISETGNITAVGKGTFNNGLLVPNNKHFRSKNSSGIEGVMMFVGGDNTIITGDYSNVFGDYRIFTGANERIRVKSTGNIGIGTTTPDSKLTVAGNIHAQEVKVTVNAGADFVFDEDYNLPKLKDVAQFILANKHLPEIASEKEMHANGILLAEMNIKLLQKIEELTLYTIQQEKQLDEQATTNRELEIRLLKLEQLLVNNQDLTNKN